MEGAWTRRPAAALARLAGRPLLLLSVRDLLLAAHEEAVLLVALLAPVAAASAGFARAARDAGVPLLLARPSGAADELGPQEARDDAAFVEAALRAADGFDPASLEVALGPVVERSGRSAREIYQPIRVAITGTTVSPGIFDSLAALGREESIHRIEEALSRLR